MKLPKIAICFSGQLRELDKSFQYWKNLIDEYEMDVYGSFWDTEETVKSLFEGLNPVSVEYEDYDSFRSTIDIFNCELIVPTYPVVNFGVTNECADHIMKNNTLSMWYKVWRSNLISKKKDYDIIIRSRTDIYFDELIIKENDKLNIPWGWIMNDSWSDCSGPIDMFAFGNSKIMDYYSCLWIYLTRYLKEGHYFFPAEHMLKAHLSQNNIKVEIIPTRLFLFRDGLCFNHAWGITEPQTIETNQWVSNLDPIFSFYKKLQN